MRTSVVVDQVAALRTAYPTSRLVVFLPRMQLGQALETALARRMDGWDGIQVRLPRQYATDVSRVDILQSGRREAPVEGHLFRVARILQDVSDGTQTGALPGWHLLARTVADAIETLREGNVGVEAVRERAKTASGSDTLDVVAECYDTYLGKLEEEQLYDDARVFEWATARVEKGRAPGVDETVFAVASAADLSEHAARFLQALQSEGRDFVRVGAGVPAAGPPATAEARFPDVRRPDCARRADGSADASRSAPSTERFLRAVGSTNEVKAVFRDLLENEVPFGEATIAYTTSQPYASLLADEADRAGIPLTMGTGLPADHTRTGRALRGLFEWTRDEYNVEHLIRMLRSGLLRLDRWVERRESVDVPSDADAGSGPLRAHEAASLLAERSYEPGREGLLAGVHSAIRSLDEEIEQQDRAASERQRARRTSLTTVASYVDALVDLFRDTDDLRQMASAACTFLRVFGPTDRPSTAERDRSPDQAARALLYDRLEKLSELDVTVEAPGQRLAALLGRWLEGQYVQAESPRPGHVHVLPFESAGYDDRSHLYVVGLDSSTFSAPFPENGMLQETDRRALLASLDPRRSPDGTASEGRTQTASDEVLWQAERALRRHQGATVYASRIFDVEAGEERDPSSLFLQRETAAANAEADGDDESGTGRSRVVGLLPESDGITLSDDECWLATHRRRRDDFPTDVSDSEDGQTARDRLKEVFPWLLEGEAARLARRSDRYTRHDGLLPDGSYPALRLLDHAGRPLSASRIEMLAEAPYLYFLKYVLGVRPLEEPAIDDEPWLNHLRKGTLLHEIYERFMRSLEGAAPSPEHDDRMDEIVENVLEEECEAFAPPSSVVKASARRILRQNAAIFLQAESERAPDYRAEYFEWAFGRPPRHRREDADGVDAPARIPVGASSLTLRGRIDRVDRQRETGRLSAWDYKTGGSGDYEENDPLQDGTTLQWALYAYAIEELTGEPVHESGYFFANVREMGRRISASPERYRADVEEILADLDELAQTGTFPITPRLNKVNAWKWGGYEWLVHDLGTRRDELKAKEYPDDRPKPRSF